MFNTAQFNFFQFNSSFGGLVSPPIICTSPITLRSNPTITNLKTDATRAALLSSDIANVTLKEDALTANLNTDEKITVLRA